MPRKKPTVVDPLIAGTKRIPKWFAKDHCYNYPWKKSERREYLFYLINLYTPTKSGYLMESKNKMWQRPNLTPIPDRAYVVRVADEDVGEAEIRRTRWIPRYYHLVMIPREVAIKWYNNNQAWRDTRKGQAQGEIIYF